MTRERVQKLVGGRGRPAQRYLSRRTAAADLETPSDAQASGHLQARLSHYPANRRLASSPEYWTEQDVGAPRRIKVIVANTTRLFADGLIAMLRTDPRIELVAEVGEDGLLHGLEPSDEPIVVLIECLFSAHACPAILAGMTQSLPSARALVVTRPLDDDDLADLIAAGAFGCLTPDCRREELIDAVERVSRGEVLFPSSDLMRLLTQRSRRERAGDAGGLGDEQPEGTAEVVDTLSAPATNPLAPREREVLETLALGLSTEDVAERMGITVNTVRTHLKNALLKLNSHSKLEAVINALRDGFIELPR